ncbi:MAG TPA: ROK family protein [Cyclobacteriaceae bacterium]
MKDIVVGIDIGGTKTKVGLVSKEGSCMIQDDFRTKHFPDFQDYLKNLNKCIDDLVQEAEEPLNVVGLGIGAPNASHKRGTIEHPPNLIWKGITPLVTELRKYYDDIPIKMTNDANAAAMGERLYGNAQNMEDFIVITLGTGLGTGIICNGELVYGFDGFAGELGHISFNENGRLDGNGIHGGLEAYVSATGLKRTIMYLLSYYMEDSRFRNVAYNDLHGEEITEAAENGDFIAVKAYAYTGEILGRALANFMTFSQPEAFFLLGGLANSGKWIFEPAQKYMDENLMEVYKGKVKVLPSGMEEKNAAILGAAALIWSEYH